MRDRQPVLIVDDEPMNLEILEDILSSSVVLRRASNGPEALEAAEIFRPDLILLDITMPGMSGYEVCKAIRRNPNLGGTRIILLSAKWMVEERLKGYESGADDYLIKPFDPDELLAKASVHLRLTHTERALQRLNEELEEKVQLRSDQLVTLERSAFLGAHAAEIVDTLGNPLTAMMGNLNLLAKAYPDDERIRRANSALVRIQSSLRSVLTADKRAGGGPEKLDLNEILKEELRVLELEEFFRYQVKTSLDLGKLDGFFGDAKHFSQSFGNLIKNAVEAMHASARRELKIRTYQDEAAIHVEICDSGTGIPAAELGRIFDPFFTTKPQTAARGVPVGTGLGLASVKRMLSLYGSEMRFESSVGLGTTVRVRLPRQSQAQEVAPPSETEPPRKRPPARPLPRNEAARIEVLRSLEVLDTREEQVFDDLTLIAAEALAVPMAAIGFVDSTRNWFKSARGIDAKQVAREVAFCSHAILSPEPFVVEDLSKDGRFMEHPLVVGGPNIRFYAAAPLVEAEGHALGTVCVMDRTPRKPTPAQLACLQALSRHALAQLEWRKVVHAVLRDRCKVTLGEMAESFRRWPELSTRGAMSTFAAVERTLRESLEGIRDHAGHSSLIRDALARIQSTVVDLVHFSIPTTSDTRRRERLVDCVEEALSFCRPYATQIGADLRIEPVPESFLIDCDKREICHLIFEMLRHDLHAVGRPAGAPMAISACEAGPSSIELSVVGPANRSVPHALQNGRAGTSVAEDATAQGLAVIRMIAANHGALFRIETEGGTQKLVFRIAKSQTVHGKAPSAG